MREYTAREMKLLKANPYTYRVTKSKLYFTAEFKELLSSLVYGDQAACPEEAAAKIPS